MRFKKNNFFLILMILIMIFACVLKQELVDELPILAHAGAVEDDELMVSQALNIIEGNWLGNYNYNTIIKNVSFSIMLAFSKVIGITYINFITVLYSLACIIFILAISKKVKNKLYLLVIFLLLLFNPITYSEEVMQRVYRNSVIPALVVSVVSAYIGMFFHRDSKIYMFFSIIGAISLPFFYYAREDSMWLVPYIVFITASIIVSLIIKFCREKDFDRKVIFLMIAKMLLLFLPIITTSMFGKCISAMNLKYYNTTEICNSKKYSELMNAIYSVKAEKDIPRYSNTKEKLEKIANVSPTFAIIKPKLDDMMKYFETKSNGEVLNGLFSWPLITAIYQSGYNTPEKEDVVITNIVKEINEAQEKGLLEKQNLMPILGCEMLEDYEYRQWFEKIITGFKFIGDYNNVKMASGISSYFYPELEPYMSMFKEITGNRVVFNKDAKYIDGTPVIELKDQDVYIKSIEDELSILTSIKNIYRNLNIPLKVLGMVSYLIITVYVFVSIFKKKYDFLEEWIFASGILGSIFTIIVGVSYVELTQTKAIVYMYLAGAFPLYVAFSLVSIYTICKLILPKIKKVKENS